MDLCSSSLKPAYIFSLFYDSVSPSTIFILDGAKIIWLDFTSRKVELKKGGAGAVINRATCQRTRISVWKIVCLSQIVQMVP